ncbi:MAG: bifunctional oligoribonuclease/PAP phosphatase NrnA [Clostridia bacterium]|nr:bifunctional oligoribonuclease/PAP phosphatase NrnA [Clostridia bacterium]
MISLTEIAKQLKKEKNVAIFCHVRPDGDCIGSSSALSLALTSLGVKNQLFCDDVIPEKFASVKGKYSREIKEEYSCMVSVDCADIYRLGSFAEVFTKHKNTFNIDHHISNTRYAKVNFVKDTASNCENIYALLTDGEIEITKEIANYLLTGIVTDTGNFKHKNVTPSTLFTASKLLEKGADLNKIVYDMFVNQPKRRATLFSSVMNNIRFMLENKLAIATITLKDIETNGAKPEDTEGFIDFLMTIEGVEVGITIMEMKQNLYKISLRSKGVNVNEIAGVYGGGGHVLASGCQINGEYEEVVDKLRYTVSQYIPE